MCIDKESTSAGLYGGMLPVVNTCTIPYAHVLYMGCGKGRYVNGKPMYKGSGRGWGEIRTLEHMCLLSIRVRYLMLIYCIWVVEKGGV